MSKKKGKFDLTHLVHTGDVKDGQDLFFVSNPKQSAKVAKQPNNEYKVVVNGETMTVHAFATKCLGMDPPDHATKWLRDEKGTTLYDMWHKDDDYSYAA
jgi:hypothetical protein